MSFIKPSHHVINFKQATAQISLPEKFTYPFCYQPHALAKLAAEELQQQLLQNDPYPETSQGRMYGVLVVKDQHQQLGYLAGLSGTDVEQQTMQSSNHLFVPAIFSGFPQNDMFFDKQAIVNQINEKINQLQRSPFYHYLSQRLTTEQQAAQQQISRLQQQLVTNRQARKQQRALLSTQLTEQTRTDAPTIFDQATQASIALSRQSVNDKKQLASLKGYWQERVAQAQQEFTEFNEQIEQLKANRKKLSHRLQKHLFKQYRMLNANGECRDLLSIFQQHANSTPPAGAGDCAAPKLLQFAFQHQLTPICMAEFWWGAPANSAIRKHQHFYPACQSKCLAILNFMLDGLAVDENPLLNNPAKDKDLAILYHDQHLVVVNKPFGLLSVPGKNIQDSVYTRIKSMFPEAKGGMVLHRLDMATSGLLVLSLNERAHKDLQKQFINKEITKQYIATLDGIIEGDSGIIRLPLLTDIDDRPRQKVCYQYGKYAETHWQVLERTSGQTKIQLLPITGRTHQLRVHCAHTNGLNTPIVGDGLYGTPDKRLKLHAQKLCFSHPISKQPMRFFVDAEF